MLLTRNKLISNTKRIITEKIKIITKKPRRTLEKFEENEQQIGMGHLKTLDR